ncbi:hypothetical protein P4C99_08425 [Pontiellaceae bacterium B1224]|nr:hypothetical protein [Pontiellaceae bacterium B1224]
MKPITMISVALLTLTSFLPAQGKRNPKQQAFCDQYMPLVLELHKTQGPEAALEEIERIYQLAERQFNDTYFFYSFIWYEAQMGTGKADEEWGLAIFQYLWDRDLSSHPEYALRLPSGKYCLLDNIIHQNSEVGRVAQARALRLEEELFLITQKGLDTSGNTYSDLGPIVSFLPEARRRTSAIYEHELPMRYQEPTTRTREDFIDYPYIYVLSGIADTSLESGDWVKAAELSDWCIRYADEYLKGNNYNRGEVAAVVSYESRERMAALMLLHGYPDEAAQYLRTYVAKAEDYYRSEERDILRSKSDLAAIRIQLGELSEDDLILVDQAEKAVAEHGWFSRSSALKASQNRIRVYHALGQTQEAWEMLDALMAEMAQDVNPYHWVRMLNTAIDLALTDGAVRPELEEWLILALENARRAGNKFEELPLYEKYAQFLMMKGRYQEAIRIQQEALRLARAMSLPKRISDNRDHLADMQQRIEDEAITAGPAAVSEVEITETKSQPTDTSEADTSISADISISATILPAIDIQPRLSLSAALPEQAAYGRFYLHNAAAIPQPGTIQLSGALDQPDWRNEQWLTVNASPTFETVQLSKDYILEAGASCIIDIFGLPLENGEGAKVGCHWIPAGKSQAGVSGTWEYRTAETGKRTAVVDAHELQDNPYYLIPIHHMIQRTHADQQATVDFTVEASSSMRIETYDATSGELLAIDANGDGDFLDRGDQIVGDDNRNSWPDLVFTEGQCLTSLVMYVQPAATTAGDIELTVKTRTGDEWQVDAIDVIKTQQ